MVSGALSGQNPGTKEMIDPDGVRRDDLEKKGHCELGVERPTYGGAGGERHVR